MANPQNPQQQTQPPFMKRAVEKVKEARLFTAPYIFGNNQTLVTGKSGGLSVEAMALHPAGLAVAYKGKRYVIPSAHVEFVTIADEET